MSLLEEDQRMRATCKPRESSSQAGLFTAVSTTQAVLPGEDHMIRVDWEEERAALSELPDGGGPIVLIPREVMHRGILPSVGLLAVVDGVGWDGEGSRQLARCAGLRRVEVLGSERRGSLLLVRARELAIATEAPAADLARLRRVRGRILRDRGFGSSRELFPDLPDESPDRLADLLADELQLDGHSRLALLSAVSWVDRLVLLERLSKPRRQARRRGLPIDRSADNLEERVKQAPLPEGVRRAAERDLVRYTGSHGAGNREAVEVLLDLQWTRPPASPIDAALARQMLDASHAGLGDAKQAVMGLRGGSGVAAPPGTRQRRCADAVPGRATGDGQEHAGESIALATGRRLERLAIGGVDDVFLIGADRTYNRSRPGEIVRRLRAAQVHPSQLVFLLDEIDKARSDPYRSPLPVLLSLLDPSQNSAFQDHFLDGVRIDLSGCLFVATANEKQAIPPPLLDRLQFIDVPAYSLEEQLAIARSKLLPKLLRRLGITNELCLDGAALRSLVYDHPHQPGCRQLEQRLQLVVSRGIGRYMEREVPVVVDTAQARSWCPPEAAVAIGFQASTAVPRAAFGFEQ
jgi:hypothetical protein